jgi:hypothetical protein
MIIEPKKNGKSKIGESLIIETCIPTYPPSLNKNANN